MNCNNRVGQHRAYMVGVLRFWQDNLMRMTNPRNRQVYNDAHSKITIPLCTCVSSHLNCCTAYAHLDMCFAI